MAAGAFFVYDALEERVISSAVTPYREAAYELVSGPLQYILARMVGLLWSRNIAGGQPIGVRAVS